MDQTVLSQIITSFGPAGSFVGYLIWQQMRRDKIDQERVETDKELATALANLTNAINNNSRGPR
jgi:hypothetical protein